MTDREIQPSVLVTEIGNRNTGDEVAYAATARRFLSRGWRVSFLCRLLPRPGVVSELPVQLHEVHVEDFFEDATSPEDLVTAFSKRHPEAFEFTRELVRRYDLVAVAPGGRFTSGYNNPRALLTAAVAQHFGVPVINLHQSVGPLDRETDRKLVAAVWSRSMLNLVRDDRSSDFLTRVGVPPDRLVLSRDVAFGEEFMADEASRFDVGINVRHGFNGHVNLDVLRDFLALLRSRRPGLRALVYSTTHALDDRVREVAGEFAAIEPEVPLCNDCLRVPASCRVNISDSYHGAIFSMVAMRPVICCRADFNSWKMPGTFLPILGNDGVLPGFTRQQDVPTLIGRTLAALDEPGPILERQNRLVAESKARCESGWESLWRALEPLRRGKEEQCASSP